MEKRYVSIVLPTYNRVHSISKSIESIQRQTYPYWELRVIDDGSTDNTEEIITEMAVSDSRIHYYRQPQNRGVSAARNEGIRQSQYDHIAFQDSDDIWKEDKLQKQMQVFEDMPEVGMVYCICEGTQEDGTVIRVPGDSIQIDDLQGDLYRFLLQRNVIDAPTVIMRRQCLERCGLFDERLTCLEDWELFLRIAKVYQIGYVNEPLLISDIHEGGVSSQVGGYFFTRCIMLVQHRAELLKYGMFEETAEQVLMKAEAAGVFQQVVQMMERMLRG